MIVELGDLLLKLFALISVHIWVNLLVYSVCAMSCTVLLWHDTLVWVFTCGEEPRGGAMCLYHCWGIRSIRVWVGEGPKDIFIQLTYVLGISN